MKTARPISIGWIVHIFLIFKARNIKILKIETAVKGEEAKASILKFFFVGFRKVASISSQVRSSRIIFISSSAVVS